MKYLNASTRTLVDFPPTGEPVPVYFLYQGKRVKIDAIIEKITARRTFCDCIIYRCMFEGKMLELRWDKKHDRWYIEKMEVR